MNPEAGLYVHYPFCVRKCPYCDFNSYAAAPLQGRYAAAVAGEIAARARAFRGLRFTSAYFGGGTPSLWDPGCVRSVLAAAADVCEFGDLPEVSLEVNPGASSPDLLSEYRAAGVSRVSVGAQSFDPAVLAALGRIHAAEEGLDAIAAARAAGFERVGVDLMYGAPAQSAESLARSIKFAVAWGVDHVSLYALTVHDGTPFAAAGEAALGLPSDGEVAAMYEEGRAALASAGFVHYEISNWARQGSECRHNVNTWTGGFYLGGGAGAHGHAPLGGGNLRYANIEHPDAYLGAVERGDLPQAFVETVDAAAHAREMIYTGLRMMRGLDLRHLASVIPPECCARVERAAPALADEGLVEFDGRVVRLSARGELFADRVALGLI